MGKVKAKKSSKKIGPSERFENGVHKKIRRTGTRERKSVP